MKVKYRFKDLETIYEDAMERIKKGNPLDDFDAKIGTAAGYAMDLMETSRNAGVHKARLDLTVETDKNIDKALTVIALNNLDDGMTEEECVQNLIKKASSYQLFTLCNLLTHFDAPNEIVFDKDMSENLLIKTKRADDTDLLFDPKTMMESVADKCFKFVNLGADHPAAMICLDWYKQLVSSELLWEIELG